MFLLKKSIVLVSCFVFFVAAESTARPDQKEPTSCDIMEYFSAVKSTMKFKFPALSPYFNNTVDALFLLGNPKTVIGRHSAFETVVIKDFPQSMISGEIMRCFMGGHPLPKGVPPQCGNLTLGEFSLNLKLMFVMYLIITEFKTKNSPGHFVILEDDAVPAPHFAKKLQNIENQLQDKEWHSVMIGGCGKSSHKWAKLRNGECVNHPECTLFKMPSGLGSRCTMGTFFSYAGAEALLNNPVTYCPIDWHINFVSSLPGYQAYWAEPWLVEEGERAEGFTRHSVAQKRDGYIDHNENRVRIEVLPGQSPCDNLPARIAVTYRISENLPDLYRESVDRVSSLPSGIPRIRVKKESTSKYLSRVLFDMVDYEWIISMETDTFITNASLLCEHVIFMYNYGFEYSGAPDGGLRDEESGWPPSYQKKHSAMSMSPSFNVFNTKRIRENFRAHHINPLKNHWGKLNDSDFDVMTNKVPTLFGSEMPEHCLNGQCEEYSFVFINLLRWCIPLYLRPMQLAIDDFTTTVLDQNRRAMFAHMWLRKYQTKFNRKIGGIKKHIRHVLEKVVTHTLPNKFSDT